MQRNVFFSHRKGSKGNITNLLHIVSRARSAGQMARSYPDRFLSCVFYAVLYPKRLLLASHSLSVFFFYTFKKHTDTYMYTYRKGAEFFFLLFLCVYLIKKKEPRIVFRFEINLKYNNIKRRKKKRSSFYIYADNEGARSVCTMKIAKLNKDATIL